MSPRPALSGSYTCNMARDGPHPYGIANLGTSLISQQAYDISLSLSLPRSPPNLKQGNFMLSLSLLSPSYKPPTTIPGPPTTLEPGPSSSVAPSDILHISRRPAILRYESALVSYSSRLAALPLYILGLRREAETLTIPMAESTEFSRGWKNVPSFALLELQAGQEVQVYDVRVHFVARFGGMRWLMYNHRILSFITFTTMFWLSEVLFTALGWLALRAMFSGTSEGGKKKKIKQEGEGTDTTETIKKEEETDEPELSDTPRNFPTYGRQQPLRFVPKIKQEDEQTGTGSEEYVLDETQIQPLVADEEDNVDYDDFEAGGFRDSGVGTSYSDAGAAGGRGLNRRKSRGGRS
ncbi:hypothetical protein BP6252_09792 [Coleophoma cylindrospora]|uniref:Seipin n=1 Tax=Coleophoma cylindrospora TaxID=1849047 RepID=A0A3D8QWL3_9HELO|nr:hypothetical protein BP6252_09792 [Coleophoma cylindrospora]